MKLSKKLILPVLALGLCASSAFAMKVEKSNIKNKYSPDKEFINYTGGTIAASQAFLGLASLGDQGSAWRNSLNTIGMLPALIYYLNCYFFFVDTATNPLLCALGALTVLPSTAYTFGILNPELAKQYTRN